jgi:DASH complex subunit DAD1
MLTRSRQSLDSVLTNLNRLNRSLEAVIAVGNEFSSVEALWSTFEGVMGDQQISANAEGGDRDAGEGAEAQRNDAAL